MYFLTDNDTFLSEKFLKEILRNKNAFNLGFVNFNKTDQSKIDLFNIDSYYKLLLAHKQSISLNDKILTENIQKLQSLVRNNLLKTFFSKFTGEKLTDEKVINELNKLFFLIAMDSTINNNDKFEVLGLLINAGVDVNEPFYLLNFNDPPKIMNKNEKRIFIEQYKKAIMYYDIDKNTALIKACENNDLELIQFLVKKCNVDVNLDSKIDQELSEDDDFILDAISSPIQVILNSPNIQNFSDILIYLLKIPEINISDTIFDKLIDKLSPNILEILLEKIIQNPKIYLSLFKRENLEKIKKKYQDINFTSKYIEDYNNCVNIIEKNKLEFFSYPYTIDYFDIFFKLYKENDFNAFKILIKLGFDINYINKNVSLTLLGIALRDNNLKWIEFLVNLGANPNNRYRGKPFSDFTETSYAGNFLQIPLLKKSQINTLYGKFLHEADFLQTLILTAHRWSLKGTIQIEDNMIDLEGSHYNIVLDSLMKAFKQYVDENRTKIFKEIQSIYSDLSINEVESLIKIIISSMKDSNSVIFTNQDLPFLRIIPFSRVTFEEYDPQNKNIGHFESFVIFEDYLLFVNRGQGSKGKIGIEINKIKEPERISKILSEIKDDLNQQELHTLFKKLILEKIDLIDKKPQRVGNCKWASQKALLHANIYAHFFQLMKFNGIDEKMAHEKAKEIAKKIIKPFTIEDRFNIVAKLLDFYKNKTFKEMPIGVQDLLYKIYKRCIEKNKYKVLLKQFQKIELTKSIQIANLLMEAIRNNDTDLSLILLAEKPYLNYLDKDNNTALHCACEKGNEIIVNEILKIIGPNNQDPKNLSPLYIAKLWNRTNICRILEEKGYKLDDIEKKSLERMSEEELKTEKEDKNKKDNIQEKDNKGKENLQKKVDNQDKEFIPKFASESSKLTSLSNSSTENDTTKNKNSKKFFK